MLSSNLFQYENPQLLSYLQGNHQLTLISRTMWTIPNSIQSILNHFIVSSNPSLLEGAVDGGWSLGGVQWMMGGAWEGCGG